MKAGAFSPCTDYRRPVILRATIESPDGERRHLEVTVETFKQGRIELDKLTPTGWHRVHIITGHP